MEQNLETKYLFEYLLRLGDNALILSHRLSEWCGHAPSLEEDIALANIALDLIGQARFWLDYAGEVEGKGRGEDDLAMLRDVWDFRNLLLVEQPNGDFAQTMMRQYLFDQHHKPLLAALANSRHSRIAAIADKALKEAHYHLERSSEMVIALGDGSAESHARMQTALDLLYPYMGEIFAEDPCEHWLCQQGIAPDMVAMRRTYDDALSRVMGEANLRLPTNTFAHSGGKTGTRHSEHLGHILPHLQWLQRAYPEAQW